MSDQRLPVRRRFKRLKIAIASCNQCQRKRAACVYRSDAGATNGNNIIGSRVRLELPDRHASLPVRGQTAPADADPPERDGTVPAVLRVPVPASSSRGKNNQGTHTPSGNLPVKVSLTPSSFRMPLVQ
ncbi:hypothetical protein MYCTH_2130591 [Thermothelomyces thermophilus ATCC 42464]|uniref:Uncharacterized protein n=1 Tax=Thermothelomyces thermophilus (strain ATCC 42464 / BCRC 31852 / DSM 1799) TaxID=573729 RepID=G2QPB4_THET4|nr:uncharacterized protein MYCTH_2130591 [Thermothelomyces thermophilus ATCC 42464]AEO61427.1 hypothetical protein MYCTH_2130591 [Thermothelomyces thermophilus ATCC 42464]